MIVVVAKAIRGCSTTFVLVLYGMMRMMASVTVCEDSTTDFEIDSVSESPKIASPSSYARVHSCTEFAKLGHAGWSIHQIPGVVLGKASIKHTYSAAYQVAGTRDLHNNDCQLKHHHHHHHHHQLSTSHQ